MLTLRGGERPLEPLQGKIRGAYPIGSNLFEKERRDIMSRAKAFGIALTCLAILLAFSPAAMAFLPANPLQAQVDAADPGDTILVNPGTYTGYLNLDKPITIEANGEGVILVAPESGDLTWISASGVVLKGLVLDGGVSQRTAIGVGSVEGLEVRNCTFRNLQTGIWIDPSSDAMNVVVANNIFENVRDYGIDNQTADNTSPYFRCLAIGNRFTFDSGTDPSWTAFNAESRKGNIALFNTFEDYTGHKAINTPESEDIYLNAEYNYWGEDAEESGIDAVCSPQVDFTPWSFADAVGHTDYQEVPLGESTLFDVGASEEITLSIEQITTLAPSTNFPLALAAYGPNSPCPTTVQEDNPDADSYTAYFILQDVEPGPIITTSLPFRLTARFPKEAIGEEADLNNIRMYTYQSDSWVDVTDEAGFNTELDGDNVLIIIDDSGDPGPFAITAGNGETPSSGCSSTGAGSIGLFSWSPSRCSSAGRSSPRLQKARPPA
jgi:hypothetical protein